MEWTTVRELIASSGQFTLNTAGHAFRTQVFFSARTQPTNLAVCRGSARTNTTGRTSPQYGPILCSTVAAGADLCEAIVFPYPGSSFGGMAAPNKFAARL